MSLAHYMCVIGTGKPCSFENGYTQICDIIHEEKYRYSFHCAKASKNFEAFMNWRYSFVQFLNLLIYSLEYHTLN